VRMTRTVEEASARLPADVVILDEAAARAGDAALQGLRERADPAALLLRAAEPSPELERLMDRLGVACLLPAEAPHALQARLVALAARHARDAARLADRVRELEQSRARFRDVIERTADAIVVTDQEGVIRFANAMAEELFGNPRDRLVGTPFGFPVLGGETTELDLVKGGEPRVVEMRVVESEWEGERAFIASLRDITERKRAEEAARTLIREQSARAAAEAAARRFRFVAEATTLLTQALDYRETLATLAGLCVREIADWVVVYEVDEAGAVKRLEVTHRDPAKAEVVRAIRELPIAPGGGHPVLEVLRTGEPLLTSPLDEERLRTITTDERHMALTRELGASSLMLVPLIARDRKLGAIGLVSADPARLFTPDDLALAMDVARRAALSVDNARLYRTAKEANAAKSNLLAVISHDLRTPLNSIIGHADLLEMGIPDPLSEGSLERVGRIRTGASHLLYLIDELLSFARLESGHEEIRLQDVEARTIAKEVSAVVETLAVGRGLAFQVDLPEGPVPLRTDPDRLRQVLLNLVGNAVKYTERGQVRLALSRDHREGVRFEVSDTGVGIRAEDLEHIFEPFWQADPTQRVRNGGTGLGLSVVRELVRLLGGEMQVVSELGRGSTFTLAMPPEPTLPPLTER
jgi:signal transduction histidine kinase/PAS domain-containing protein